jgi:hypothetical protein
MLEHARLKIEVLPRSAEHTTANPAPPAQERPVAIYWRHGVLRLRTPGVQQRFGLARSLPLLALANFFERGNAYVRENLAGDSNGGKELSYSLPEQ